MRLRFLISVAFLTYSTNCIAADDMDTSTGNGFLQFCGGDSVVRNSYCIGYIQGVISTDEGISKTPTSTNRSLCIPTGVTMLQLQDIVIAYLKYTPEERHWPSWILVHNAINKAFPCQKSK